MIQKTLAAKSRVIHLRLPTDLCHKLEQWIDEEGITLANFCREAIECYLLHKHHEARQEQLKETCHFLERHHFQVRV